MFNSMLGPRPKPKKFNMHFQHYDPKEDERREQRLKFKRSHKKNYKPGRSVLFYAAGIIIVFYLMFAL